MLILNGYGWRLALKGIGGGWENGVWYGVGAWGEDCKEGVFRRGIKKSLEKA